MAHCYCQQSPHAVDDLNFLKVLEAKAAANFSLPRPDLSAIRNARGYKDVFIPLGAAPHVWIHAIQTRIFDSALRTSSTGTINVNDRLRIVSLGEISLGLRYSQTRLWRSVKVSMEDFLHRDRQAFERRSSNTVPSREKRSSNTVPSPTSFRAGQFRSRSMGPISKTVPVSLPGSRSSSVPPLARKALPNQPSGLGSAANRQSLGVQHLGNTVRGVPAQPWPVPTFALKPASTGPSRNLIQSGTTAAGMILNPGTAARRTEPPLYKYGITWEIWKTALFAGELGDFKNQRGKYLLENSFQSFKDDLARRVKTAEYARLADFMITTYGTKNPAPPSSSA